MVPTGTKVIAHKKLQIGLIGHHMIDKQRLLICLSNTIVASNPVFLSEKDNIRFTSPHVVKFIETTIDSLLCQATMGIITLCITSPSTTMLSLQAGHTTKKSLLELATILE